MEKPQYVRVAVNIPAINSEFDYSIPENLQEGVQPGCLVEIPFSNRTIQGVITRFIEIPDVPEVKPVAALMDPIPVVTPEQFQLAVWMSKEMLTPLGLCMDMMLPPGLIITG